LLQFPVWWSLANAFRSLFYFCEFCREHRGESYYGDDFSSESMLDEI
jgi:hypothetical protein